MSLPRVIADTPLDPVIEGLVARSVEILPWAAAWERRADVKAVYTYGHPLVDGAMLDRLHSPTWRPQARGQVRCPREADIWPLQAPT